MNAGHGTSPVQALGLILRGPLKSTNPHILLLDYRDPSTFSALWFHGLKSGRWNSEMEGTEQDEEIDLTIPANQILLIGNDPPEGVLDTTHPSLRGINFRGHFSAASWLAAWRLRFPDSPVRIAVIDPREASLASGAARALQSLFSPRDAADRPLVPGVTVLNAPSLETICRWLSGTESRVASKDTSQVLDLLRSVLWSELSSDREQHHALSNVLGALLLLAQVGSRSESGKLVAAHAARFPVQPYLVALARACGITPDATRESADSDGGDRPPDWWVGRDLNQAIPGAVQFDDMSELWQWFLQIALGFCGSEAEAERFVTTAPGQFQEMAKSLPARLDALIQSGRERIAADDLVPGDLSLKDQFVLFLDLRLGLGTELQRRLEALGKKLLRSGRNLPWLTDASRAALEDELQGGKTGETLLPRLLALIDPTLPIVIFSSTHRRELIEPFRDYGNLITTFRKPVLSGMTSPWAETVRELHGDFVSALEQAARILRARQTFRSFHAKALPCDPPALPASEHGWLIEIFIDESEEPTETSPPRSLCAGGVIVVRTLNRQGLPEVSDVQLLRELVERNCLWGWCVDMPGDFHRPSNTQGIRRYYKKGAKLDFSTGGSGSLLLEEMLGSIREALGGKGVLIPFAAIDRRSRDYPSWMEVPGKVRWHEAEKLLDASLRKLVLHALETLLFRSRMLRSALENPATRVAIDLGIRDYPCRPNPSLAEAFGIEVRNHGWRASFQSEDGYQITAETLARAGIPWPYPSGVVRARAVALRDFGNNPNRPAGFLPKQLHYFADVVAHLSLHDLDAAKETSGKVRAFFESGWVADFREDPAEAERLEIGRAWDQGDRLTAIRWADCLRDPAASNGLGIDIFGEIARGERRLSGGDLKSLFAHPGE